MILKAVLNTGYNRVRLFFASCRDCPSYIASSETVRYILHPAENNGFRRERNGVSRQENSFHFLIFLAAKKSSLHVIYRPEKVINTIIFRLKVDVSDVLPMETVQCF